MRSGHLSPTCHCSLTHSPTFLTQSLTLASFQRVVLTHSPTLHPFQPCRCASTRSAWPRRTSTSSCRPNRWGALPCHSCHVIYATTHAPCHTRHVTHDTSVIPRQPRHVTHATSFLMRPSLQVSQEAQMVTVGASPRCASRHLPRLPTPASGGKCRPSTRRSYTLPATSSTTCAGPYLLSQVSIQTPCRVSYRIEASRRIRTFQSKAK